MQKKELDGPVIEGQKFANKLSINSFEPGVPLGVEQKKQLDGSGSIGSLAS